MFGGLASRLFDTLEKAKRGDASSLRTVAGGINLVNKIGGGPQINVDKLVAEKSRPQVYLPKRTITLPRVGLMPQRTITTLDKRQNFVDNIHSDLQTRDRQAGAVGLLPGRTFQGSTGPSQPQVV